MNNTHREIEIELYRMGIGKESIQCAKPSVGGTSSSIAFVTATVLHVASSRSTMRKTM